MERPSSNPAPERRLGQISIVMSFSGIIANPVGNIRISCNDPIATTGGIRANNTGNGKDSTISVVRIQ